MGFTLLVRCHFYIESGPWPLCSEDGTFSLKSPTIYNHCMGASVSLEFRPSVILNSGGLILTAHCWGINHRAVSRSAPSQWERASLCNDVSHWLGTNLESALNQVTCGLLHIWLEVQILWNSTFFSDSKDSEPFQLPFCKAINFTCPIGCAFAQIINT